MRLQEVGREGEEGKQKRTLLKPYLVVARQLPQPLPSLVAEATHLTGSLLSQQAAVSGHRLHVERIDHPLQLSLVSSAA